MKTLTNTTETLLTHEFTILKTQAFIYQSTNLIKTETIIKILNLDNFYGEDETIEIAKGKYKLAETLKEGIKQIKRLKNENRSN